ncbi:hypothetical protein Ocin01_15560 [Orchesella cincta]|uniref:diacylglycerol O-acyltransferase n=1 Tax=Orchesella cincta TaxID=48709 RepID=A0A1D2MDQ9_ORCCI|nr:hypothetical protein Ocin01_15560 [Orchesella cincta]
MATSNLPKFLSGTLSRVFKSVPCQATLCFLLYYSTLIVSAVPLALLLFYRFVFSLLLKVVYNGKLKLASGYEAMLASLDSFAQVVNITFFLYVDGHLDIESLRKRIATNVLARDEYGKRPYDVLFKSPEEKFGFTCFRDKSDEIDFKNHVKLCPGVDDPSKIYSEHEFLDAVAKLADYEWDQGKPKWELLVTPRLKREGSDVISSGIVVKFHHLYGDGISVAQFLRNCILDQPAPKLILDPVNPPIPPVSLFQKFVLALQIFFLGPYTLLRLFGNECDPVFCEGALTGGKLLGRTKMNISLEMMRRIRKFHKCSTQAVLHSAFVGSFEKMAKKKWLKLPDEIIAGVVFADFPYPDEYPKNYACFGMEPVSPNIANPAVRLVEFNKCLETLYGRKYALKASNIQTALLGLYPAAVIRYSKNFFKHSYSISNVPGIRDVGRIGGNEVGLVFGVGALFNCNRYHAGVGLYGGSFRIGVIVEASKIIRNRKELEEWIQEMENEIRYLDRRAIAVHG